jgi:fasciclin domain-containing protein
VTDNEQVMILNNKPEMIFQINNMINRIIGKRVFTVLLFAIVASCTKTEEPPAVIGKALPFPNGEATRTLVQLLDSIPTATIYRAAYHRSGLPHYIDSLRAGNARALYTLFVPTDAAFQAAGYSIDIINSMSPALSDSLARYLAIAGNYPSPSGNLTWGGETFYPMMYPDAGLTRTQVPSVFGRSYNYYYTLNIAYTGNTLLLNGKPASAKAAPIPATDGTIYMIDTLVIKPFYETYQVLQMDTSYSFFMAALRISDSLYAQQGILASNTNLQYPNDTIGLVLQRGNTNPGYNPFSILFAPVNDAFRRAGFNSIGDISNYINGSALASANYGTYLLTNMDSILNNHIMLINFGKFTATKGYIYTDDILLNPAALSFMIPPPGGSGLPSINASTIFPVINGSQITLHRKDSPNGRGANLIDPSNITTLNGVIHRVDNLLLPTP